MKGTGTVAGVPDTVWIKQGQVYGLELKAPGGRLTPAQCNAHEALRAAGAEVGVAHGVDEAVAQLERWGLLRGRQQ
jgi:hypothetical protein